MRVRTLAATTLFAWQLAGCVVQSEFVPVSPSGVRDIEARDPNRPVRFSRNDTAPAVPVTHLTTTGKIATGCKVGSVEPGGCPLDDSRFDFFVEESKADYANIVVLSSLVAVSTLEIGCFSAWCSESSRHVVIGVDAVAASLAVLAGVGVLVGYSKAMW
jgi:hypothetical protein